MEELNRNISPAQSCNYPIPLNVMPVLMKLYTYSYSAVAQLRNVPRSRSRHYPRSRGVFRSYYTN